MKDMLRVKDIHTYYGQSYILQGISLEVTQGAVVSILGRNGVGKTTTFRSIIGFTPPQRGRILFKGIDITRRASYKINKMKMALVPQGRRIFSSLSVEENLAVATKGQKHGDGWNAGKIFGMFPRLKERLHHRGDELSGGEQQMLAIARALVSNPVFILLDEPTEGLAPLIIEEIRKLIVQLKDQGLSMLIAEQNFRFALDVGDMVHIMSKGKIVHTSTPDELYENEEIKSNYLGI